MSGHRMRSQTRQVRPRKRYERASAVQQKSLRAQMLGTDTSANPKGVPIDK
jgi:hypothetical protein